ncbi:flagellar motor switch protein FliG [Bacillus sp. FJAT-53711]|uniref:Flagellar motor switch protein FliG n=1 Tax=Bacillus yunxiaonensis TaxID=3127665 RepID=A0ABU8FXQ7_9BACI
MNIFLCGSNQLTTLDQTEIKNFLSEYAYKHNIYVLCYKSIENEVLRFFVENERLAPNLYIYTLQPLHVLSNEFQDIVTYLKAHGSQFFSFNHPSEAVYRSEYIFFVKQIIENTDLVLCFYNGDKHTAVIPVDVAKEIGTDALIFDLPILQDKQVRTSFEQKIRIM